MDTAIQAAGNMALMQAMGPAALARAAAAAPGHTLDQAAQNFEGMFMAQMLQPMFDTVGVDPIFGGGHGEEVMRGLLVQEYGKYLAKANGMGGLTTAIKNELIRAQSQGKAKGQGTKTQVSAYGAQNAVVRKSG